jgi:hypothetical protein
MAITEASKANPDADGEEEGLTSIQNQTADA